MVQSLLGSEEKPDVYDLPVADGIKEMLIIRGYTRERILNTKVSSFAENLQIVLMLLARVSGVFSPPHTVMKNL